LPLAGEGQALLVDAAERGEVPVQALQGVPVTEQVVDLCAQRAGSGGVRPAVRGSGPVVRRRGSMGLVEDRPRGQRARGGVYSGHGRLLAPVRRSSWAETAYTWTASIRGPELPGAGPAGSAAVLRRAGTRPGT